MHALIVGLSIAGALFSYRFPFFTVLSYFVFGVLPNAFTERFPPELYDTSIGLGLNAVDLILVGMVCATIIKLILSRMARITLRKVSIVTVALSLYMLFEIVRNIGTYGLSAPGEFRYRYFMLFSMFYVAVMFDTPVGRLKLLKLLTAITICSTFLLVLIIGAFSGWSFGAGDRFIHSSLALALFLALASLFYLRKQRLIKMSNAIIWVILIPGFAFLVVEGHRSVWLCMLCVVFIFSLVRGKRARRTAFGILTAISGGIILASVLFGGLYQVSNFLSERTMAYRGFEADPTGAWRMKIWEFAYTSFKEKPAFGDGFGAHGGSVYDLEKGGRLNVFIHSYYMMNLIKLGVVGFAILIFFGGVLSVAFYRSLTVAESLGKERSAIILIGFVSVVTIHVYGIGYGLEYFCWLFVGLGLGGMGEMIRLRNQRMSRAKWFI